MSATPSKVFSWPSLQGLLVASALLAMGTPAGFSIGGLSWKFPWLSETSATPRTAQPTVAIANKPVLPSSSIAVQRVWSSQASVMFCVTVKNDQGHSIHLRSGHLNLSEVGMANADWPAVAPPQWDAVRLQLAKVQIFADRELPGTPHGFKIDLKIPPGHQRKFLLQIDAANIPIWQHNRFFAVGSLVVEEGAAELATPDLNLFGQRLVPEKALPALIKLPPPPSKP